MTFYLEKQFLFFRCVQCATLITEKFHFISAFVVRSEFLKKRRKFFWNSSWTYCFLIKCSLFFLHKNWNSTLNWFSSFLSDVFPSFYHSLLYFWSAHFSLTLWHFYFESQNMQKRVWQRIIDACFPEAFSCIVYSRGRTSRLWATL